MEGSLHYGRSASSGRDDNARFRRSASSGRDDNVRFRRSAPSGRDDNVRFRRYVFSGRDDNRWSPGHGDNISMTGDGESSTGPLP